MESESNKKAWEERREERRELIKTTDKTEDFKDKWKTDKRILRKWWICQVLFKCNLSTLLWLFLVSATRLKVSYFHLFIFFNRAVFGYIILGEKGHRFTLKIYYPRGKKGIDSYLKKAKKVTSIIFVPVILSSLLLLKLILTLPLSLLGILTALIWIRR